MELKMIRGDSMATSVACKNSDGTPLPFVAGDTIYFTVKKNIKDTTKLIQKTITAFDADGKALINLLPSDTSDLEFGMYVFDVQFNQASTGLVATIIPPSMLEIGGEVTYE